MVTMEKALDALADFACKDAIASMPDGAGKFACAFAVRSVRANPERFLAKYGQFLKDFGIVSEDGKSVDEAALHSALKQAFAETPEVPFMGFTFTAQDADRLLGRMRA